MLIRKPQPRDIDAMIALAKAMHDESEFREFDFDRGKVTDIGVQVLTNPGYFSVICEHDDKIIGLMVCYVSSYYFGNDLIASDIILYIDKTRRGGVGGLRMIEQYVEWAAKKGCKEVQLGQTAGIDPKAVDRLYTHAGFKMIGQLYKRRLS